MIFLEESKPCCYSISSPLIISLSFTNIQRHGHTHTHTQTRAHMYGHTHTLYSASLP